MAITSDEKKKKKQKMRRKLHELGFKKNQFHVATKNEPNWQQSHSAVKS